ncbi:MAG: HD domain-containing protein [Prevotella sp.]|nr:HD domain-containing protein [Prevotella sp.]
MIDNNVSLDLMEFVEQNILPRYNEFDRAHNIAHATQVIRKSVSLARNFGADVNMAYVIAAYHDLGLEGPRAIHHVTSGKILEADRRLRKWFSISQLKVMREAVEDHRASASHAPRSLYGKIVAEADRNLEPETVVRRTIQFGIAHYPEKDKEEQWRRFMEHMDSKYSIHGYVKLWLPGSENERNLNQLRALIANPGEMRPLFERIYSEERGTSEQ